MENNLFDIIKFRELIEKLNNYCSNKNKNISTSANKDDFDNIDEEDKCFRFSMEGIDEYMELDKNIDLIQRTKSFSQKNIRRQPKIINIFNKIFEK